MQITDECLNSTKHISSVILVRSQLYLNERRYLSSLNFIIENFKYIKTVCFIEGELQQVYSK